MTDTNIYDGKGRLHDAIASLLGLSIKSKARIVVRIKEARAGLGIGLDDKLSDTSRLAIWQWLYDRLHSTNNAVEINSQDNSVKIITQTDGVEIDSHIESLELCEQAHEAEVNFLPELVNIIAQYPIYAHVRIAFYTTSKGVKIRQVIALDGFYVNALMSAIGINKSAVPAWIQKAVDSYADFDSSLPITKQVKYLLIKTIAK